MGYGFNYNIDLPTSIAEILDHDFWILEDVTPSMLSSLHEPVKFASSTWIFLKSGNCQAELNFISYDIKAPALIMIRNSQILTIKHISDNLNASIIVMSKRFKENIFMFMNSSPLYGMLNRYPIVSMPSEVLAKIPDFFADLRSILEDKENPYVSKALVYTFMSFVFKDIYRCFMPFKNEMVSNQGRMSEQFIYLAQEHFKTERFLDFYAEKLEVSPKHLSRTVKKQTGYSAVEWIERFVILEAKVLLKSSNLNIQQIADELNFPSQSFFGKYFKKFTGMSPKEFRNS